MRNFILVLFLTSTSASAEIIASDANGVRYLLKDDGTYTKLIEEGLSDEEFADRAIAVVRTYRKIFDESLEEQSAECLRNALIENSRSKFQKLHFMNPEWEAMSKWMAGLPIKDGIVLNEMEIALNPMMLNGIVLYAMENC